MLPNPAFPKTLCYIILMGILPSIAAGQTFAVVNHPPSQPRVVNAPVKLRDVLLQLKESYKVDILFEDQMIKGMNIPQDILTSGASLEHNLERILAPNGLRYKKIKENTYIILSAKRREKKLSFDENAGMFQARQTSDPGKDIPVHHVGSYPESVAGFTEKAKDITVRGKVTDEKGEGLPGVNVLVKGTQQGTITDVDGMFTLDVPDENAILVMSFVGYETQEVVVGSRTTLNVTLGADVKSLDELVVIGYGTAKKSDLTGAVQRIDAEKFKNQNMVQLTDMLAGTVAGFNLNQSSSVAGGGSMEVRGPTSIAAGSSPMIVLDGVIYNGSLRDINPSDIASIDILKDASAAAIFGAKAASGVVVVNTHKGKSGKPVINFTSRVGFGTPTKQRRGLGPDEYIQFRSDYLRTISPDRDYHFFTNPDQLPPDISIDQWRNMSPNPLADNVDEYLVRLKFFQIEQEQYKAGKTIDWYDVVMRNGIRQNHDVSISGGSDKSNYYFSLGYVDNDGLQVGEEFSTIRSRLNLDFKIAKWLSAGVNTQFSDRDESGIPASSFYANSPYGREYDPNGNLERMPHGHTNHPLLEHYLGSRTRKINSLFANIFADVKLPFGIDYRLSFQPRYETMKDMRFRSTDVRFGGLPNSEQSTASRDEYSRQEWIVDNILKWNKEIGIHHFDVTLLYSVEKNQYWSTYQSNLNFSPNQELSYHGMQFGNSPSIRSRDEIFTGEAMMARLNYTLMDKYLFTGSIRRDGFSAFGQEHPYAVFPAAAFAWQLSRENFYNTDWLVNRLKLRISWGLNGNRDIGIYSALATVGSDIWYDGSTPRVGLYTSTLSNPGLAWEKTQSINLGLDMGLFKERLNVTFDVYRSTTTDLLMNRRLPTLTGFTSVTTNLGAIANRGVELTLESKNYNTQNLNWKSSLVFSLNRNEIRRLFGDTGEYTLLGETKTGELPDYTNQWFPGRALDAVWNYNVVGVWQVDEADEARKYILRPGDFKSEDVNKDGVYRAEDDKQFIGFLQPRYRLGLGNDLSFFKNWSLSVFIRGDLGHIGEEADALNPGNESNDRWNRNVGPVPYWTPQNPINDYARLDVHTGGYGGGLKIYRPRSFVRLQDISLSYNVPNEVLNRISVSSLRVFANARNLLTITKWPHWDPESGTTPMPQTFTLGLNLTL